MGEQHIFENTYYQNTLYNIKANHLPQRERSKVRTLHSFNRPTHCPEPRAAEITDRISNTCMIAQDETNPDGRRRRI